PGTVQEPLRQRPELPSAPAAPVLPEAPAPAAPGVPPGGRQVLVQRFEIAGNSALPAEELARIVAPFAGRSLTLLEIYEVADAVTRYYRERGYTLATAAVPAQK